jgi:hypothetical protein
MSAQEPELFDIDWGGFKPWQPSAVRHRLSEHPLFDMDSLVALGQRLEARRSVRSHSDQATAGTSFAQAPQLHPSPQAVSGALRDVAHAQAWMSLLNVQSDATYRRLVDQVFDDLAPMLSQHDPGLCYRGGWIFITSPGAVTPFHMDKEHNFILQIRGSKTLYVWDPDDTEVLSEAARDLFHATHSRDRVQWQESHRARAHRHVLQPGMGAYMPSTSPHLVENGDNVSVTASFTYYSDATRRNALLHTLHHRLREHGGMPPPVGAHPWRDSMAYAACRSAVTAKQWLRRIRQQDISPDNARYAHVFQT